MEESCEVQSDENRSLPEKKPKRMVKTPSQVEALENFYDEHKYPTESMKLELAESIGLTEKQVSGWFCHRRLKDKKLLNGEAYAHGRQDRSSGVIQDHGSGLKQDSCGSTKQGDYRHYDAREVESRRLAGEDLLAADLRYELGSHQTGNNSSTDDTSSGSRSPLEDSRPPQNTDPFSMASSRYLPQIAQSVSIDMNSLKGRTGPAGYLKVKGMVENSAITSVKRQLGRHYREDGPPLCVEFELLPPGAFESRIKDPVDGSYYAGEPFSFQSDCHPYKQPDPGSNYLRYNIEFQMLKVHPSYYTKMQRHSD
ncbi:hypothetical protein RJ639_025851 [Escallonia herrerae]|uniref:Homeobox domain-containing protein n=1 Tax=Escallonia herrerae TaxID=1293975 RepID=A0AA88S3P3_9ASTE|nr:hypothetical protein RJ639_025851 [Escallonia herrerae]